MGNPHTFKSAKAKMHLARIMQVMRNNEWQPGSDRRYATETGLSIGQARRYTAKAWKLVCAEVNDADRVGFTIGTALEAVVREALDDSRRAVFVERGVTKDGTPITHQLSPNESRSVVVSAAATWAKIAGVNAAEKHELTGKDGAPIAIDVSKMTDEQLLVIVDRSGRGGVGDPSTSASSREPDGLHPEGDTAVDGAETPPADR